MNAKTSACLPTIPVAGRRMRVGRLSLGLMCAIIGDAGSGVAWAQSQRATNPTRTEQTVPAVSLRQPAPLDFDDHTGYVRIFDGQSLQHWDGDPAVWHVENGAIVGIASREHPRSYIAYRGFEAKDFDLKLEIKADSGGSGIQYRSRSGVPWRLTEPNLPANPNWLLTGPQADFWSAESVMASAFTGQFYSENTPEGIVAWRGQVVESSADQKPRLIGTIGDRLALGGYVRNNTWNEYLIMARGGTFIHIMNGQLMAVYVDDDPRSSNNQSGVIGVELEGMPAKVSVRNVWIRRFPAATPLAATPAAHPSIAGRWKLHLELSGLETEDPQMCEFAAKEQRLTGHCSGQAGSQELTGEIAGSSIRGNLSSAVFGDASFSGTIDSPSSITGVFNPKEGDALGDFSFTARRME